MKKPSKALFQPIFKNGYGPPPPGGRSVHGPHGASFSSLLLLGKFLPPKVERDAPAFDEAKDTTMAEPPVENYQIGDPQLDPSELTTETLMDMTPSQPAQTEQINDDNPSSPSGAAEWQ